METILVKDIYNVDTISKGNAKAWIKLMEFMKDKNEDVEFDFKGIEVVQPWATPEFMLFMQNEYVHIRLWFAENTVNSINIMCALNGINDKKAVNEEVVPVKVPSQEEIKIQKMAEQLQEYFDTTGETPVLNIYNRFDQIGVHVTIKYIEAAVALFCEKTGAKRVFIETKGIIIQPSVIEHLTDIIKNMAEKNIVVHIHSDDPEVMNKVGIYQALAENKSISVNDKINMIKAKLTPGKTGMLIKYKESKATDEFGRRGKGKPVSCRVAIYGGLKRVNGSIAVCIRTFNGNTFFTKTHWSLEHDNAVLEKLEYTDEVIPISEFGMYNDFLGSKYHFIAPIQTRKEDTITLYGLDEFGKVTYNNVTIPERIKIVFEDWEVKHDAESLDFYIQKTREVLKNSL